jgi:hypothetical protein
LRADLGLESPSYGVEPGSVLFAIWRRQTAAADSQHNIQPQKPAPIPHCNRNSLTWIHLAKAHYNAQINEIRPFRKT